MNSVVAASRSRTSSARRKVGVPRSQSKGAAKELAPNDEARLQREKAKQAALDAHRRAMKARSLPEGR
jgi:hypothetical protein